MSEQQNVEITAWESPALIEVSGAAESLAGLDPMVGVSGPPPP